MNNLFPKTPAQKRAEKREQYRKLGQAISALRGYDGEHQFEIKGRAVQDRNVTSTTGPRMNTLQFERTLVKR
jgi:hypothetical protein